MKTVLLDDETFALKYLERLCFQIPEIEVVAVFTDAEEALEYLSTQPAKLIITDIEMPGLTGMEAAQRLRTIRPDVGIIFVTGYEAYALQAFQMEAVAYLLKPCGLDALQSAVKRASLLVSAKNARITIRTFGHFSVLLDNTPLRFSNSKAKELLALLVDRNGAVLSMEQVVDTLWEDRFYDDTVKRLYRKAVGYLHQVFDQTGFFVSDRGSCHIVPAKADCDYFRFLQNPSAELYQGEYLLDYSWAESTNGKLSMLINKL